MFSLYRNNAMLDNICSHVIGPQVGTWDTDCYYYVVNMYPALHRPAFYNLVVGWVVWSEVSCLGFSFKMDRVHVVELLDVSVLFLVIFCTCLALVVLGGGSTGQWWGGGPFLSFYGFLGWSPCVSHFGNVLVM